MTMPSAGWKNVSAAQWRGSEGFIAQTSLVQPQQAVVVAAHGAPKPRRGDVIPCYTLSYPKKVREESKPRAVSHGGQAAPARPPLREVKEEPCPPVATGAGSGLRESPARMPDSVV